MSTALTPSTPSSPPPIGRQALVAALQWGLVQAALLGVGGGALGDYHQATTGSVFAPGWVSSIQFAVPVAFLVGAYGGWTWVTSGRAARTRAAHRTRVRFVVALVALGVVHLPLELAVALALGDALFTVPYFLVPTGFSLAVLVGAYLLAYRVDPSVYVGVRDRLVPTGRERSE